ncbi:MAG TPA: 2-oxoglutarate dehydrogenase E1 component [bacterium]|jgi:2-oxoglutarate dehydrogenase E1 component
MTNDFSFIGNAEPSVIEGFYEDYLKDPASVDVSWRSFFEGFDFARRTFGDGIAQAPEMFVKESRVLSLIGAYRTRGHLFTRTNPVRTRRKYEDPLTLESFGLAKSDLGTVFQAGREVGLGPAPLSEIVALLEQTYCRSVAVEFRYMRDPKVVSWLQTRMESCRNTPNFSHEERLHIIEKLTEAEVFEKFMHTRFVGQKRFSIEGVESVVPAIDAIVEKGADLGIEEFIIGMAHRGRLNILATILDKSFARIFAEFEGKGYTLSEYAGDVKYHLGHSCEKLTRGGKRVRLSVAPNPSHLEAVDPVAEGIVRARLDQEYRGDVRRIAPILIHGDASLAGQGIVYEVLQMSQLDGYGTGGTIHIALNNQVGFTTNYLDGRSSTYCTDVAKVTLSPVFHVNGDDVEAVVYVINLALEFREAFKRDVFVDLLGYRRYGHNEGDEPRFTQPILYKTIAQHPHPIEIYANQLAESGALDISVSQKLDEEFRVYLDQQYQASKDLTLVPDTTFLASTWKPYRTATHADFQQSPETGVELKDLKRIAERMNTLPEGPKFFAKIQKIFDERQRMITENRLDWALGELLAYATLVAGGVPVRITGQDTERGTFSHRHAVVKIEDSEEEYIPLENVSEKQASFRIYNSPLSEYGVLGFEYGYALALPRGLTVWEAQYGDFASGAQTITDEMISSGETKWQQMNGLVLFLPHGYEGQGPDHSSARMERYLSLCADDNMQVVNITTPANMFHVLRRQVYRPFRKPLVVMTPKSLLRHPQAVSPLEDFAVGTRFQELLDDVTADPAAVKRVLMCSGKIYYELVDRQQKLNRNDVAIVRIEQLYPLPEDQIQATVNRYKYAREYFYVQEEPENMGAGPFMHDYLNVPSLKIIARRRSSTTATGFPAQHVAEQQAILEKAFA